MNKIYILIPLFLLFFSLSLRGNSLTLDDCIKIALKNNHTIKKEQSIINQYEYRIKKSISSFYPTINLSGGYSYIGNSYSDEGNNNYSLSLNLNQLFFNGLSRIYTYKIARYEKLKGMQNYYNAINDLIYNIKENYFKILLYNEQIKVIKKIIERKKEDLVIIKLKYDAGKENAASVMEMEADLKESEYNLLEQEENLKTIKTKLYLLMGVETDYEINTENYKDNFPKIIYDDIIEKVEKNYPNLNIVKLQIQIEKERLKNIESAYFPDMNLTGGYNFNDDKFFPENRSWNIGLNISLSLFSGFNTRYSVSEQKNHIEELKESFLETENSIKMTILELVKQYNLLKEKIMVIDLKYKAALENYKLIKLQYKQGKISYLWLKQKETELTGLELQKEQVIYNMRSTLASIEKYTKGD